MVLTPFKNERTQKITSALVVMASVLAMGSENIRQITLLGLTINMFVVGIFMTFVGMLYFLDV